MAKQSWKPGNMLYPIPAVLVTCKGANGEENVLTVGWAGTINTNPPMLSISVRPERHSYELIRSSKEFVVNLTTKDMVKATDYCGVVSGRDVDKFASCGLTKEKADVVSAPLIAESPVNIECRVTEEKKLGSHSMFIAKVVAVHADEAYMDDKGSFSLAKANPIVYCHGEYFALGAKLGKFGYSVRKKKKSKNRRGKR
ncbi:MAG: flavin reductase family protein [Lachnospiraceae bacterium]|nr:flavin reductase family protein [Lachnospiraceae bacterium]